MIRKIIIALISTVLFSLLMAYLNYVPISERELNVYYNPLWSTAILFSMYSLPVYLIGGISSSYLIDKLVAKKTFHSSWNRYLTELFAYLVLGIVAAFLYLIIMTIVDDKTDLITDSLLQFMTLGFIAFLIFYHVLLVFRFKRR